MEHLLTSHPSLKKREGLRHPQAVHKTTRPVVTDFGRKNALMDISSMQWFRANHLMTNEGDKSYPEWIPKYVGICIGFVYSLGLLVVARHLSRYGVSTFSLFQTQYLIAGVLTVSPPIAFALV